MPSIDDQLRERITRSAPRTTGAEDLFTRLDRRKRRRVTARRTGTVALVVCVLVATAGTFLALGRVFGPQEAIPIRPAPQPIENLGFEFPICRVMSMPITIAGAPRTAFVVSEATGGCPGAGEGHRYVGVDVDGDGAVDAIAELHDCFPPVGCETFAAPDVNGDGTSEIATSEAGADGYGISLYEMIGSPPALVPIEVADPLDIGNLQPGALQFAWVDVYAHTEGARCVLTPSGSALGIYGYDKTGTETDVRTTTLSIEPTSATATVTDTTTERMPVDEAPVPGSELCGTPIYGSAGNFPDASKA